MKMLFESSPGNPISTGTAEVTGVRTAAGAVTGAQRLHMLR